MHIFHDEDMILMPGGEESFCNDFCVDLCINDEQFKCDVVSCLNGCNLHFGNDEIVISEQSTDEISVPR